jgi:N-acetylneuraminate lyase
MKRSPHVLVAPVTPMDGSAGLDLDSIPRLFAVLRARGADGFYLTGGTGEGMLLTVQERMDLVECWRDVAGSKVPIVVHVGCVSLRDARVLAKHAAELDVAAISSVAPPVYTAADVRQLIASFREIVDAAPETPFYFYHNAASAGPKISGHDFLTAAADALPTLAGMKFTHEDLFDLSRCLRFQDGRYRIFYGKDEFFLGAHAVGAADFIGGSFNIVNPLVKQSLSAFAAGDIDAARAAHGRVVDVIDVLRRFGGLPAVKAAMTLLGVPCGPCRLPLRSLPVTAYEPLFSELRQAWPGVAEVAAPARTVTGVS